jgi:hypothetical protein
MERVDYRTYKGLCFCKEGSVWARDSYTYEVSISLALYPNILNTLPKCIKTVQGDRLTLTAYSLTQIKQYITHINDHAIETSNTSER